MAEGTYEKGLLVPTLGCAATCLMRILPHGWLAWFWPRPSAVATELYVLCWFVFELIISVAVCLFYGHVAAVRWVVYLLAVLRSVEIMVRAGSVDPTNVISPQRTLVLAAINYVELMLWFGQSTL